MKTYLRVALLGLLLSHLGLAWAQSAAAEGADRQPWKDSQELAKKAACVQRAAPPELAPSDAAEARLLRVRLVLKPGDVEPTVDLLWNGLDADSTEKMQAYLRSYRMPCLGADEAPRSFVQEFWLRPRQRLAEAGELWGIVIPTTTSSPSCLPNWMESFKPPSDAFQPDRRWPTRAPFPIKIMVYLRFQPDSSESQVEFAYQMGSVRYAQALLEHFRSIRSCKDGSRPKGWQPISLMIGDGRGPDARMKPRGLVDFLGQVQGGAALRARFDTSTMSCPFKVTWILNQPIASNGAYAGGDADAKANRAAFVGWIGSLKLALSQRDENDLFMEKIDIDVPCIVLDLGADVAKP